MAFAAISRNGYIFAMSLVLVGGGATWLLFRCRPENLKSFNESNDWDRQLVTWEYERLVSLAKAVASAAVGFFTALLVAAVKGEVADDVTTLHVVGCFLGIIGCLVVAARLQADARTFARRHVGEWLPW